jgi:hypothetical protein
MAYRELFVLEIKEVLRLWVRGHGYRSVARMAHVDRKTARRYLQVACALGLERTLAGEALALDDAFVACVAEAVLPGSPSRPGAMREHCRAHADLIRAWYLEGCKGPKVVRLLARHTGVVVPLRTLQRFAAQDLALGVGKGTTVRLPQVEPGKILEIDFLKLGSFTERGSGRRRPMFALLCVAANSRHQFVWPCLRQTCQDVIAGLEAAWRFFGGVFPILIPDNMSSAVRKADPLAPILIDEFRDYAQRRGFEVDPARAGKPKDKARVERQVTYVRNDYFRGERFGSVSQALAEAKRWCRQVAGQRVHGTTRKKPMEAFEEDELPLLAAAPIEPYDQPRWSKVNLGRDHAVVVDYALYSVPFSVSPGELRARIDLTTLKLYRKAVLVKVHPRQPEGGASIDPQDAPPGKALLVSRDGAALRRIAASHGPSVGIYAERLLDSPLPWRRLRQVYRLVSLCKRHGASWVDEACARALELDVVDIKRIERMLERGLIQRGLLVRPSASKTPQGSNIIDLRFARHGDEWRIGSRQQDGEPDASA